MYIPSSNFETPQDQEIVCVLTGESYVHIEGHDLSIIDPKYHKDSLDTLPARFFSMPWVIRNGHGQIRVFGRFE